MEEAQITTKVLGGNTLLVSCTKSTTFVVCKVLSLNRSEAQFSRYTYYQIIFFEISLLARNSSLKLLKVNKLNQAAFFTTGKGRGVKYHSQLGTSYINC